jgi:hypothetical protein
VTFQGFVAQNNDFTQSDADIVWSAHDNLLYVTWADSSPTTAPAAMFQIFDSGFNALSAGATLSQSIEYAGDVTLAATANGIAFSYLHNDANDVNESLTIIQGTTTYVSDSFAAGPANENPAISLVNGTFWATVSSQSNGQFSLHQLQFGVTFSDSLFALAQSGDEHSPLMGDQGLTLWIQSLGAPSFDSLQIGASASSAVTVARDYADVARPNLAEMTVPSAQDAQTASAQSFLGMELHGSATPNAIAVRPLNQLQWTSQ